ncbi:MAG: nuclear transport factor 2 family protein [Gemmatimonadaceae bacterium]|nr:nuclear transport factor 2 family protein [Gemmatimonadaceae bacterium]
MSPPIDAIRARRAASNAAIAARDPDATAAIMHPDVIVSVAGGPVLRGRQHSRDAFAQQFADRSFRGYVREPATITIDAPPGQAGTRRGDGLHATETGRWRGSWLRGIARTEMRGTYVAQWCQVHDTWLVESEVFVEMPDGHGGVSRDQG